jgi:hypothetical protein
LITKEENHKHNFGNSGHGLPEKQLEEGIEQELTLDQQIHGDVCNQINSELLYSPILLTLASDLIDQQRDDQKMDDQEMDDQDDMEQSNTSENLYELITSNNKYDNYDILHQEKTDYIKRDLFFPATLEVFVSAPTNPKKY